VPIKLRYERDFIVEEAASNSIDQLLELIYDGLKEDYASPMGSPKSRIGF
jgi:hypothetical protein